MRPISQDLLNRLEGSQQTIFANSAPALRLVFSKGLNTDLFLVYTIQEGETLNIVDVAVRRETATDEPSRVYALVLDGDVASVKSRKLPYDERGSWRDEFTIGSGITDGAIEFDGVWERQASTARFNLVADEYPWVFYVQNGTLYAKYWEEEAIVLSTGVSACSALRGWQSIVYSHIDQGLIIGYTKSGSLYYRNYAYAEGIGKGWEAERVVPGMPSTCTNVSLFRLNDFRMGFLVETSAGEMSYKTTTRDWAGMASPSEYLTAGVTDLSFVVNPILYMSGYAGAEYVSSSIVDIDLQVCPASFDIAQVVVAFAWRANSHQLVLQFSHSLLNVAQSLAGFSVGSRTVTDVAYGETDKEVVLTTQEELSVVGTFVVTYSGSTLRALVTASCKPVLPTFSTTIVGAPLESTEQITASVADIDFTVTQVYYESTEGDGENLEASVTDISFVVTKVGSAPL